MKPPTVIATAALIAFGFASSVTGATASGFSGKWPLAVTKSKLDNGAHCLTLTDDGSAGWPHSGPAVIQSARNGTLYGTFQFIDHIVMVSIDDGAGLESGNSVYAVRTSKGNLVDGGLEEVYGGASVDSGEVVAGSKGNC